MTVGAASLLLCLQMFELTPLIRKLVIALLAVNFVLMICAGLVTAGLLSPAPMLLLPVHFAACSVAALFAVYIACRFPMAQRR
ncbi:hypothetical protein [Sphingomonas sp. G-3-2-10]|uniref:hypothetical protein n=1 Tax=Sphingomonas sp. G-3-2-10 TaxID=2728838 RepID=UPI00146F7D63|nr:hypothetical protein [Sphingomonas sp. G-3-2-10]NML07608.1 hypothetical protein [Sphingomonas sp. G-3-2-10]